MRRPLLRFPIVGRRRAAPMVALMAVIAGAALGAANVMAAEELARYKPWPVWTAIVLGPPWWVWTIGLCGVAGLVLWKDRCVRDRGRAHLIDIAVAVCMVVLAGLAVVALVQPIYALAG